MSGTSFNVTNTEGDVTFIVNSDDISKDSAITVQQYSDAHGHISDDGSITIPYSTLREIYWALRKQGFPG